MLLRSIGAFLLLCKPHRALPGHRVFLHPTFVNAKPLSNLPLLFFLPPPLSYFSVHGIFAKQSLTRCRTADRVTRKREREKEEKRKGKERKGKRKNSRLLVSRHGCRAHRFRHRGIEIGRRCWQCPRKRELFPLLLSPHLTYSSPPGRKGARTESEWRAVTKSLNHNQAGLSVRIRAWLVRAIINCYRWIFPSPTFLEFPALLSTRA